MTKHHGFAVWTPNDSLDLAARSSVDRTLQRLVLAGDILRIDRGLYDVPRLNQPTGKSTNPDYTAVVGAVARREEAGIPDGITAVNQLGLTNAVPAMCPSDAMIEDLRRDNGPMAGMIIVSSPTLGDVIESIRALENELNYQGGRP